MRELVDEDVKKPYPGDFFVDENIIAHLPPRTKILSANRFGNSTWSVTARLLIELPDGTNVLIFLKSASGSHGGIMLEGEFTSMTELHQCAPDLVPKPQAWGRYAVREPETYFFIAEYVDMADGIPDPEQLCGNIARLHANSRSPNGKFGFHVTTCQGHVPQATAWEKSWTVFFARLMEHMLELDIDANGAWPDLETVSKRLLALVVPRLLNALEHDGRTVKPSLIHGDLWEGNMGTSVESGNVCLFDAAALYAHNEMETGNWRCYYNKISDAVYTETYLRHNPPSEPVCEWEDRNRLYSTYYNVLFSANHLQEGKAVRQLAYTDMFYLVDKFAPFSEGLGPKRLMKYELVSLSSERDHTMA